ncbi:MAG: hypothetical protein VW583_08935, partial [Betaproteobacteria bacterium]
RYRQPASQVLRNALHLNLQLFTAEHLGASNKKWAVGCFAGTKAVLRGNPSASKGCNKKRVAG